MIEISDLMTDPDFAQNFTIRRETGAFVEGEWVKATASLERYGVIQPMSEADSIAFLPEGERFNNWISIWCLDEIRQGNGRGEMSDIVVWNGLTYRVAKAKRWEGQGYYRAFAKGFVDGS
jgi:hypothetical protein